MPVGNTTNPSPGPRRLMKTPPRATLSPWRGLHDRDSPLGEGSLTPGEGFLAQEERYCRRNREAGTNQGRRRLCLCPPAKNRRTIRECR